MPIRSMTGFAREAGSHGAFSWVWEARTVNGRGLEIRLRTPPGFDALGEAARKVLADRLTRGQCQLTLTVSRAATPATLRVNREALASLLAALEGLALPASVRPASLDGLLAVRGVVELDEPEESGAVDEALGAAVVASARRLADGLAASRAAEGGAIGAALAGQLEALERLVDAVARSPARQPAAIAARLSAQVETLLAGSTTLDPARLHAEAVLLATRADVQEEIDRIRAHLASARTLLDGEGAVGRRLDFLAQELGRETNTLCAKANSTDLSRAGLDMKVLVEQFREQVQNVE